MSIHIIYYTIYCHSYIGIKSLLKRRSPRSPTHPTKGGKERKHSKKEIHILRSEALVKTLRKSILQHHASLRSDSRAISSGRSNSNTSGRMDTPTESFRMPISHSGSGRQPSIAKGKSKSLPIGTNTLDADVSSVHLHVHIPVSVPESKDQVELVYDVNTNTADKARIDGIQSLSSSSPKVLHNTYAQDDPLPRSLQYSLKEPSDTQPSPLFPVPALMSPNALSTPPPLTTYDSNCTTSGSGPISPIDMSSPKPSRSCRETSNNHIPVIQRNNSVGTDCPSTTIDIDKYSTHINEVRRNSVVLGQISIQQDDVAVIPRLDAKNDRNIVAWVSKTCFCRTLYYSSMIYVYTTLTCPEKTLIYLK